MHESFHKAWERLKGYTQDCPHHGFKKEAILSIFYLGVNQAQKWTLDAASNGRFTNLTVEQGELLVENFAQSRENYGEDFNENQRCAPRNHAPLIPPKSFEQGLVPQEQHSFPMPQDVDLHGVCKQALKGQVETSTKIDCSYNDLNNSKPQYLENHEECIPPQETVMEDAAPSDIRLPFKQRYAPADRCGYDDTFHSSNMAYEEQYAFHLSEYEEYSNHMLFLEKHVQGAASLSEEPAPTFERTQGTSIAETTCVEPINTELSQWTEDNVEECIPLQETVMEEKPPSDIHLPLQKTYAVSTEDSDIQDGEGCALHDQAMKQKFEVKLDNTTRSNAPVKPSVMQPPEVVVVENHALRYEALSYSIKSSGEAVGMVGKTLEHPCEGVFVVECISEKHLGITSTNKESIAEPRNILFEKIRMKEFRGRFYDEYEPGDTWIHH